MASTWESIESQMRDSAPISRQRQEISFSILAPLRIGVSRLSIASPSAAEAAISIA
jgi:hypothetical protein